MVFGELVHLMALEGITIVAYAYAGFVSALDVYAPNRNTK